MATTKLKLQMGYNKEVASAAPGLRVLYNIIIVILNYWKTVYKSSNVEN